MINSGELRIVPRIVESKYNPPKIVSFGSVIKQFSNALLLAV
jgi:hypothetical protein